jgi:hypothetical protein
MATRKTTPAQKAAATRAKNKAQEAVVAASFEYGGPRAGGVRTPIWLDTRGGKTLIDSNKGRNNYYTMKGSLQASICRRMAERNWFLAPVLSLRHAATIEDFMMCDAKGASMEDQYDFYSLVEDILHEELTTTNVVCLWRKGADLPTVTVLDMEDVEYSVTAGIERITITYAKDEEIEKDIRANNNEADYLDALGPDMFKAQSKGGKVTIKKTQDEEFWDFEVMIPGKRRGVFRMPELVPILDTLDFLELMGVADWNIAWFRKDIIRIWKKGYKVTNGQGAGVNSVDITKKNIKDLGEGAAKINGGANVPANHDVEVSYLTVPPEAFDPKMLEGSIDRLMLFGGIEAVVLLGSFSQQNGAAPSLMRNARAMAFARRKRVANLLRRIFSAEEFSSLDWGEKPDTKTHMLPAGAMKAKWGVKSLYSIEELMALVKGTNDGTASTQTRREWLDLDNVLEGDRLESEHAERKRVAPPFESGQGLLERMFPDELGQADATATPATPAKAKGTPGRPKKVK